MPNELIPANDLNEVALPNQNFGELTSSEDFLQRIQLYSAKSNAVSEGLIDPNHYGVPQDNDVIDLGAEVDVILLAWRPKALAATDDPIIESFDPSSDIFKDIQARSGTPDSGCMFGPEFLLWVPSVDKFLTFFMSSKTARREARKMEPLIRCAATLKSKIIKTARFIWAGPVVIACSTPLDLPDAELMKKKVHQFLHPPAKNIELAKEDDRER